MSKDSSDIRKWIAGSFCLLIFASVSHAAQPDMNGPSATASTSAPEIYWSALDYANRTLTIHGRYLIGGDTSTPELPEVRIGGEPVVIDDAASVAATDFVTGEGSLVLTFDDILTALNDLVITTPQGSELPGMLNFAVKITATGGTVHSSSYFPQAISGSTGPPPPTTGTCPCTPQYDQYYNELYALLWPTCTAPESSNPPITGTVPVEQYIDASYIDELAVEVISIGSDSSTSPRSTLAGTCHVRTGDYWPLTEETGVFLEPPIPVSDEDHMACVSDIVAREAICRGGNWLDP